MGCPMGFELTINNKKYHVRVEWITPHVKRGENVCVTFTLEASVFDVEKQQLIKPTGYVLEKITDYIKNSINGQDTCYWKPDGINRHFEKQ